jgi:ankyrin repeat protein
MPDEGIKMKRAIPIILLSTFSCFALATKPNVCTAQSDILTAARSGNLDEVRTLLEGDSSLISATNPNGSTPLHLAISEGHTEVAILLIASGSNLNAANRYGRTPLNYAAQHNYLELAELLLASGASVNGSDSSTYSPLHSAANAGYAEMAKLLIEAGADANLGAGVGTALGRAVFSGSVEIVRMLLDAGADIETTDSRFWTPLHTAALGGRPEVVRELLDAGAEPDPLDQGGRTPLLLSILGGNRDAEQVALLLLEHDAAVGIETMSGVTPLLVAVQKGMSAVVEALLARGADVRVLDPLSGRSLLHIAAAAGYEDVVGQLLDSGIEVNTDDTSGRTALFYAARHGNRRAAELLLTAGGGGAEEENYGPSQYLEAPMDEGEIHVWKLRDRGWAVRTSDRFFVFNNEEHSRKPDEPLLANGFVAAAEIAHLNVFAVYTAYHAQRYAREFIHSIEDELDNVTYIHYKNDALQGNRNALFIGGQGEISVGGAQIAYGEEHDPEGMGWLDYGLQSDGVSIYYAGFAGASLQQHEATLKGLSHRAETTHLAFVLLPGTGSSPNSSYIDLIISTLEPEVVFLQGTDSNRPFDKETLEALRQTYPGTRFHTAAFAGERFSFSFGSAGR